MDVFTFIVFSIEIPISKQCDTDEMPRFAASELGLHCFN